MTGAMVPDASVWATTKLRSTKKRLATALVGLALLFVIVAQLMDSEHKELLLASDCVDSFRGAANGKGLGLTICRALVSQMGGEIGVESEPGAGTSFWFRLPAERAAATEGSSRPEEIAETKVAAGTNVLLVEDNPVNQIVARRMLEKMGCSVQVASNGR